MTQKTKSRRGFAAMPPEKQREIAQKGGRSHTRDHLARIGAEGGRKSRLSKKHT